MIDSGAVEHSQWVTYLCLAIVLFNIFVAGRQGISASHRTNSPHIHARWSYENGVALACLIIAVAAFTTPYFIDVICMSKAGDICQPVGGTVLSTVAVIAAVVPLVRIKE